MEGKGASIGTGQQVVVLGRVQEPTLVPQQVVVVGEGTGANIGTK
jgi:hypothetical protein